MFRLVLVHICMNNRAPEYPGRSLNQTGNLDFEEHGDMISCISSQWKQSGEGDLSVFKQHGTGTTFQNTMFTFYLVHKSILNCYVDVLIHVCISVYAGLPGRPVTYDWWDISCYKIKFIFLSIYLSIYLSTYLSTYQPIYLFLSLTRGTTELTFGLLLSLIASWWGVSGLWGLFSGSCTESSSLDSYWGCTAAIIPSTKKQH